MKPKGYSLVEMMVGMMISLVVIASSISVFSTNILMGSNQLQRDFLTSQLNMIATSMADEISRAGYCFDCGSVNPFIIPDSGAIGSSSLLIGDSASELSGTCLRFSYNHDSAPGVNSVRDDDAKGFRLGVDKNDNPVIEVYENWKGITNWNCDSKGGEVNNGYWRDATYDRLVISELTFNRKILEVDRPGSSNVVQTLDVTISAHLPDDNSVIVTTSFSVTPANVDG